MAVITQIQGLDDVQRKLRQLANPKLAKRIANRAARQAMNIVRDAARQNAKRIDDPTTREAIFKNIVVRSGKISDKNAIRMRVGILGGASQNQHSKTIVLKERKKKGQPKQSLGANTIALSGGDTRHWRYIEFGQSSVAAVPFMRPALRDNVSAVTSKFVQVFNAELTQELAKL